MLSRTTETATQQHQQWRMLSTTTETATQQHQQMVNALHDY